MGTAREKWDNIYSQSSTQPVQASEVLLENQHLLPTTGVAVDLACGLGANAILLAQAGLQTHAWDISPVALGKCHAQADRLQVVVHTAVRDIEQHPPERDRFDVVVLSHFLHRPTFTYLIDSLKPGGCLFYQTFVADKDPDIGPSNKNYLLQSNELITRCQGMQILVYREESNQGNQQLGWRNQAMIVARKSLPIDGYHR